MATQRNACMSHLEALLSLYPQFIDGWYFSYLFPMALAEPGQAERSWTFREQGQRQRQARVDSLTQCRDIKSQLLQTKHSFRLDCLTQKTIAAFKTFLKTCCMAAHQAPAPLKLQIVPQDGNMVRSSTAPCNVHKLFTHTRRTNALESQKGQ